MRCIPLVVAALIAGWSPAAAQESIAPTSEHVTTQAFAGGLGAVVGSFGLMLLGASAIGPRGGEDPGLVGAIYGFGAGLILGSSLGVHLAAKGQGLDVSYGTTIGGSLLGFLLLWPIGSAINLDLDTPAFWFVVYGVPIAGAVLMTNIQARAAARRQSRVDISITPLPGGARAGLRVTF